MPVGACDGCGRYYVLDAVGSAVACCPRCDQPLRPSDKAELAGHLHAPAAPAEMPFIAGPYYRSVWEQKRLESDRLMQRAQELRTRIHSRRHEVAAQVGEARRLARQMGQLLQDLRTTLHSPEAPHHA